MKQSARTGYLIVTPLVIAAMLFVYKTNSSIRVLRSTMASGTIASRPEVVTFGQQISAVGAIDRSLNYVSVIWPALAFGILIAAAVRAFVSPDWFAGLVKGRSLRTQLASGLAGAPLMLCSCCVAPVFVSVAQGTSRLGPALSMMLASPALNPAALILTFLLFAPGVAMARLVVSLLAVLAIGPAVEQLFQGARINRPVETEPENGQSPMLKFLWSVGSVALRTIPGLVIGVVVSMLIVQALPGDFFANPTNRFVAILMTATLAIPLALPTFLEIPLALSLLSAGFPAGAAVALLFAGPSINLPSLFSIARVSGWKVAATVAGLIWCFAVLGGLALA